MPQRVPSETVPFNKADDIAHIINMADYSPVPLNFKEAHHLADLKGIEQDLLWVVEMGDYYVEQRVSTKSVFALSEALCIAMVVKYGRCFATGERRRLPKQWIDEMDLSQRKLHSYFIDVSKHWGRFWWGHTREWCRVLAPKSSYFEEALMESSNLTKNEQSFDRRYSQSDIKALIDKARHHQSFLAEASQTDTSWVGFYAENFAARLNGKKVLELGCGEGLNAVIMALLGAEVDAVDISQAGLSVLDELVRELKLEERIKAIKGDFLELDFKANHYDFIVGKAFLHHLTHAQEHQYFEKIARLLKENGEARFFEPATNSRLLDSIRWMIPVKGRPSCLDKKAFTEWKRNDPHPERDNSAAHYRSAGLPFFKNVRILPLGGVERFHRLIPSGKFNRRFRKWAFKAERFLPSFLNFKIARAQTLIYCK